MRIQHDLRLHKSIIFDDGGKIRNLKNQLYNKKSAQNEGVCMPDRLPGVANAILV